MAAEQSVVVRCRLETASEALQPGEPAERGSS